MSPAESTVESIDLANSGPEAAGRKAGQQVRATDADIDMFPRSSILTREVKRTRKTETLLLWVGEKPRETKKIWREFKAGDL